MNIGWVAFLSDGSVVREHRGEYQITEGEPTPWVRLCSFLAENDTKLVRLALDIDGAAIHLPSSVVSFNLQGYDSPRSYSVQYRVEGVIGSGGVEAKTYIDLSSHYDDFTVHLIHDLDDLNAWILVTKGDSPLLETPASEH
jgi:hypothetical protein